VLLMFPMFISHLKYTLQIETIGFSKRSEATYNYRIKVYTRRFTYDNVEPLILDINFILGNI
jgi:hypothetical protein